MSDRLLQVNGLTKIYDGRPVLRNIDLTVMRNQCIAFVGHNGSGKTTLLKALAGLISLSAGRITPFHGITFGYVPEQSLQLNLSAAQYLRHMGRIEGMKPGDIESAMKDLFETFFMIGLTDIPMKHLSKGTLQKISVMQALLTNHDILLLDEPLSGQDTASQEVFIQKIRARVESGSTVLLSCHESFLVDRLATAIYEIRDGTLHPVQDGHVLAKPVDMLAFLWLPDMQLPALPDDCSFVTRSGRLVIKAPSSHSQMLLLSMLENGYILKEFHHADDL